jgi:hypothetical protein
VLREQILAMKPGRELDALVAEKVMGLPNVRKYMSRYVHDNHPEKAWVTGIVDIPEYSTDISAAWEVVEKMHEWGGCEISCCGTGEKRWYVVHTHTNTAPYQKGINVTCNTAPEAICKAALLALIGEDEKE